jgi:hypothetical protein
VARCDAARVTDFGSQFIESRGEAVEYEGQLVHMSHVMGPFPSGWLTLRMRATSDIEQGVGLSVDGGWLTINGEKSKQFGIWTETAPDEVAIDVKPLRGRDSASVRIWNIWRHSKRGPTMAWVSSAGILIEAADATSAVLRASAGSGGPNFDDLVIEAKFTAA